MHLELNVVSERIHMHKISKKHQVEGRGETQGGRAEPTIQAMSIGTC